MRFPLTKDNIKRLFIDQIPVVENGRMTDVSQARTQKSYVVYDSDPRAPQGLGIYIGKTKKTFILQVRVGDSIKKVAIGDYPRINVNTGNVSTDARLIAAEVRVALKGGANISALRDEEQAIVKTTLGKILNDYLLSYKAKSGCRDNTIRAIESAIKNAAPWSSLSVRAIGGDTVQAMWDKIAVKEKHPSAAEHVLLFCQTAFNRFIELQQSNRNKSSYVGDTLVNPFAYAKRFIRKREALEQEYAARQVRNPIENAPHRLGLWLNVVWRKRSENRGAADYLLLTLLTGARRSETARLVWGDRLADTKEAIRQQYSEIDFAGENGTGRIIFRETKKTTTHIVPMGRFVTWLLRERSRDNPTGLYVFPSAAKNPLTVSPHYVNARNFVISIRNELDAENRDKGWNVYWKSCQLERGLVENVTPSEEWNTAKDTADSAFNREYASKWVFTMHDLRRTFCTAAVNIEGMPYAVVKRLMNHGQLSNTTARYGAPTWDMLHKYMQLLEDELLKHGTDLPKLQG